MSNNDGKETVCEEICDFCSSPDLFYAYLASDFTAAEVAVPNVGTFVLNSLGAWLACRECTRLIEGQRWEELLERAFRTFHENHGPKLDMTPEDERLIREFLRHLHAQFRKFQTSRRSTTAPRTSFAGVN
jgi:hypothetical protein